MSDIVSRIWAKDETLWRAPADASERTVDALGWLDLPARVGDLVAELEAAVREIPSAERNRVVLLGIGGSSRAAYMFGRLFGVSEERFVVIETLHPDAVSALGDLDGVIFIVASKSGSTNETLMLEAYFRARLAEQGLSPAAIAQRFIALSDAGSALHQRGQSAEQFRLCLATPADVGGRFSAFTPFGLFPLVLAGVSFAECVQHIQRGAQSLKKAGEANRGVQLGEFLGQIALSGGTAAVSIAASPRIAAFAAWAEQLIAESTGKDGTGIVPITGERLERLNAENYRTGGSVILRLRDDENAALDRWAADFTAAGGNAFVIELDDINAVVAEVLNWEFAVAVAGSMMGINPFDQPDVESTKQRTKAVLSQQRAAADMPNPIAESDILTKVAEARENVNYVALLAFAPQNADSEAYFAELREKITELSGLPTLLGYGPSYLHSTGQLLKGGAKDALVFGFWSDSSRAADGTAHEAHENLLKFMLAQAQADFAEMSGRGQAVWTVRLP